MMHDQPPAADWEALPEPLIAQVVSAAVLGLGPTLLYPAFLAPGPLAGQARAQQAALSRLAAVCRRWRAAVQAATAAVVSWAVLVQQTEGVDLRCLQALRVASLDLRLLTYSEADGGAALQALLSDEAFRTASAPHLHTLLGVPERLAPLLAYLPALRILGLAEDYECTAGKSHLAPMRLATLGPLRLPRLRCLHLELGVVDLTQLPPQVDALMLVEADRVVLPPAQGAAVTDRLLATAEAAGLSRLVVRAASGCLVFEEAQRAPLELELSHAARLLAAHAGGWSVQLGTHEDEGLRQRLPQLELTRRPCLEPCSVHPPRCGAVVAQAAGL